MELIKRYNRRNLVIRMENDIIERNFIDNRRGKINDWKVIYFLLKIDNKYIRECNLGGNGWKSKLRIGIKFAL